jgi:predicted amidophosphoribosyltransferase
MSRLDSCPNCGASATQHTGSYCHECGEVLVPKRIYVFEIGTTTHHVVGYSAEEARKRALKLYVKTHKPRLGELPKAKLIRSERAR